MKLIYKKAKRVFVIFFVLFYFVNQICTLELNANADDVANRLQAFLNDKSKSVVCPLSEDQMKNMCKSISKAKIQASYPSYGAEDLDYVPVLTGSNILYKRIQ